MLDELMEFKQIQKLHQETKQKTLTSKQNISNKNAHQKNIIINSKQTKEIEKINTFDENPNKNFKLTLGDKVLLRKRLEEEKNRKAETYKDLHKNKKINLSQFLSKLKFYEQNQKYNLELIKYKQLLKETESNQDKPKLSYNTLKLCETMPKQPPLYKRINQVIERNKEEINKFNLLNTMPKEERKIDKFEKDKLKENNKCLNNSDKKIKKKFYSTEVSRKNDNNEHDDSFQIHKNKKNRSKLSKKIIIQKSNDFFNEQINWLKNKKERNLNQNQNKNSTDSKITFHPYISRATLEILDIKNRLNNNNNEIYKYNILNGNIPYNNLKLNKGRTIWDKLYQEGRKNKSCDNGNMIKESSLKKNPNKFVYLDLDNCKNKIKNKLNINNSFYNKNKKKKPISKFFDDKNCQNHKKKKENTRSSFLECDDIKEYNYYKIKKEKEKYHWRNSLLKMKPLYLEPNDGTYHLNIMQTSAWNDNYVNKITFDGNKKCRSVINLFIK